MVQALPAEFVADPMRYHLKVRARIAEQTRIAQERQWQKATVIEFKPVVDRRQPQVIYIRKPSRDAKTIDAGWKVYVECRMSISFAGYAFEKPAKQPEPVDHRPSTRAIIETVASHFGSTVVDIKSSRRQRPLVRQRQIAMWLCKTLTWCSYPQVGRAMGDRDHTTILHGVKVIDALLSAGDPEITLAVNVIRERLGV
jgi:hypothetical protein